MKSQGPICIGLTDHSISLRPYVGLNDISQMIARSAYAQLNYSVVFLLTTIVGMLLIFVEPILFAAFATGTAQILAALAWLVMAITFQPMLRFYRLSPLWGFALPVIAVFYTAFTFQSAVDFWRGRGGMWKGRAQAMAPS